MNIKLHSLAANKIVEIPFFEIVRVRRPGMGEKSI